MKLQVLLSAMHLENSSLVDKLLITGDCVLINQCDRENKEQIQKNRMQEVTYIETKERGLSKSRNMAIRNATADICILCDNDVKYVSHYETIICDTFEKYQDADLVAFYIKRKEKPEPNFNKVINMNYLSAMKIFSPEIAFRRERIEGITFHEEFGAGARYYMGEENIFLFDCLRKGLTVKYVPIQIAELLETESTWFNGYTKKYFISRGANYYAMSPLLSLPMIFQFAFRKRSLYRESMSLSNALQYMLKGRREYRRRINGT